MAFYSGDREDFTWDQTTGHMNSWTSYVGGNSQTGTLTWNTNGTLQQLAIVDTAANPPNTQTQTCTYNYDDLGRLGAQKWADTSGGVTCTGGVNWNQTFKYDGYYNIFKTAGNAQFNPTYDSSNHLTLSGVTITYDANGNMTRDNLGNTYAYNPEGRATTAAGQNIIYDAFDRPVEFGSSGGNYTQIVYAPDGYKFAMMNGSTVQKYMAPLAGGLQAVYTSYSNNPATPAVPAYWRHADWLGSSRIASKPDRTVQYDLAYAPYGETYAESGTQDRSFTGQTQDVIAGSQGIYDFLYRQNASSQGRWLSPDPAGLAAVDIADPQTWNRYAYVSNDPCDQVDPLGLFASQCQFNIKIEGQSTVTAQQLTAAKAEINRILGFGGSGLSANFGTSGPDFTITLKHNPTGLAKLFGGPPGPSYYGDADPRWGGLAPGFAPTGTIWADNLAGQNFSIGFGTALGRAITHEFSHWAFQAPSSRLIDDPLETNILEAGDSIYQFDHLATLSSLQIPKLQTLCNSRHGGGGGGLGGMWVSLPNGGGFNWTEMRSTANPASAWFWWPTGYHPPPMNGY